MIVSHKPKLTASEISCLWTAYVADTMAICGLKHFMIHLKDTDIKTMVQLALDQATDHVERLTKLFQAEEYPLPFGFTDQDINLEAPPLFTETLVLMYVNNMAKLGLGTYSVALSTSARRDVLDYFTNCLKEAAELSNRSLQIGLEKGVYIRCPSIQPPERSDFVHEKNFFGGLLGHKRPLLGTEVSNLFYNLKRNALGKALMIGFAQVAQNPEVKDYFKRGMELSQKQIEIFTKLLQDDELPAPMLWDGEISRSTISPFSDKLMMFQVSTLIAAAIGQYGLAMSVSPRTDLAAVYVRLTAEVGSYAVDGARIMLEQGWMERPPQTVDREALIST